MQSGSQSNMDFAQVVGCRRARAAAPNADITLIKRQSSLSRHAVAWYPSVKPSEVATAVGPFAFACEGHYREAARRRRLPIHARGPCEVKPTSRRHFLLESLAAGTGLWALGLAGVPQSLRAAESDSKIRFGLVTYQWGKDWDLPTLLRNCEKSKLLGVELRVEHAHAVHPEISPTQRKEVRKRFEDSPVKCVGLGTNENFDSPDATKVRACIEQTKKFVLLSKDIGASGVKVKPNDLHKTVPREQTIDQIGKSLNTVGAFAADHGQEIRLEVHGKCSPLPIMKQIMEVANHPNVKVCWNSNAEDLKGEGLEHNFGLVADRLGATLHIHDMSKKDYPYEQLFKLLTKANYQGWALLEEGTPPPNDRLAALSEQRELFEKLVARTSQQ
jgi:sugar phosphate isomerase/epimerase